MILFSLFSLCRRHAVGLDDKSSGWSFFLPDNFQHWRFVSFFRCMFSSERRLEIISGGFFGGYQPLLDDVYHGSASDGWWRPWGLLKKAVEKVGDTKGTTKKSLIWWLDIVFFNINVEAHSKKSCVFEALQKYFAEIPLIRTSYSRKSYLEEGKTTSPIHLTR